MSGRWARGSKAEADEDSGNVGSGEDVSAASRRPLNRPQVAGDAAGEAENPEGGKEGDGTAGWLAGVMLTNVFL